MTGNTIFNRRKFKMNENDFWWEIRLSADNDEELLSIIDISGSIGSSFESERNAKAYYISSKPVEYWTGVIESLLPNFKSVKILERGKTGYRSWHKEWKEAFPPLEVGEKFVVLAPWHRGTESIGRIPLYIYPATAFGTGYHESTRIALSLLEKNADKIRGKKAGDIGTGSGVLAIALLKIGAEFVYARDIDPTVLDEVRNNMKENGLADTSFELLTGDLLNGFYTKVDIVTANILFGPLCLMLPDVIKVLNKNGIAVFSGLLTRERDDFIENANEAGLSLIEEMTMNEWWGAGFSICPKLQ
jgi:ribosomal protein L11 methyltransferase